MLLSRETGSPKPKRPREASHYQRAKLSSRTSVIGRRAWSKCRRELRREEKASQANAATFRKPFSRSARRRRRGRLPAGLLFSEGPNHRDHELLPLERLDDADEPDDEQSQPQEQRHKPSDNRYKRKHNIEYPQEPPPRSQERSTAMRGTSPSDSCCTAQPPER